jgi:hypothetical protein
MGKLFDLSVVVGVYTDRNNEQKKRWKTIGAAFEGKDGGMFLTIDRTFNPAGVPTEDGRDSIMVSMFPPKEEGAQASKPRQQAPASNQQRSAQGSLPADDDIPF